MANPATDTAMIAARISFRLGSSSPPNMPPSRAFRCERELLLGLRGRGARYVELVHTTFVPRLSQHAEFQTDCARRLPIVLSNLSKARFDPSRIFEAQEIHMYTGR